MKAKSTGKARVVSRGSSTRLRPQSKSHAPIASQQDEPLDTAQPASEASASSPRPWTLRRVARWTLGIGAASVVVALAWAVFLLIRFQTTIYHPLPPTPTARIAAATVTTLVVAAEVTGTQQAPPAPTPDFMRALPPGRFNVLVLGTDKRPDDPEHYARSDTLLLANVDTISRSVRIMSIPRDLVVDIPDYGKNKVNSAYFFGEYYQLDGGGQALAVRTLSQFFNVPIDYYVTLNFQGFEKIVDRVGGVDIDVPYSIDDYNYPSDDSGDLFGEIHVHFDEGWQHMDGKTALRYARTRHADNDFARSKRQLQIILAVRQKATSLDLLPSFPSLLDELAGMIETNIPFDQQLALAQLGYGITASNIITSSIDSSMITPATLPDGSEGLKLDAKAAQPMLDQFFGWGVEASGTGAGTESESRSVRTTPSAAPSAKRKATPLPSRAGPSTKP